MNHPNKRFLVYMSSTKAKSTIDEVADDVNLYSDIEDVGFTVYWPGLTGCSHSFTVLERSDALLMARHWQASNAAAAEIEHAQKWGIPIFYDIEALKTWAVDTPKPDVI